MGIDPTTCELTTVRLTTVLATCVWPSTILFLFVDECRSKFPLSSIPSRTQLDTSRDSETQPPPLDSNTAADGEIRQEPRRCPPPPCRPAPSPPRLPRPPASPLHTSNISHHRRPSRLQPYLVAPQRRCPPLPHQWEMPSAAMHPPGDKSNYWVDSYGLEHAWNRQTLSSCLLSEGIPICLTWTPTDSQGIYLFSFFCWFCWM